MSKAVGRKTWLSVLHKCKVILFTGLLLFSSGCSKKANSKMQEAQSFDGTEVIWLLPELREEPDVLSKRINDKLATDGYSFRVRFVCGDDYLKYDEFSGSTEADIAVLGVSIDSAEAALKEGKYLCLDDYLSGSKLKDSVPEVLWKSVQYNGKVYSIPNCSSTVPYSVAVFNPEKIRKIPSSFNVDDPGDLESVLPDDGKVYCRFGLSSSDIWGWGFYYGWMFDEEGTAVNPFQEEKYNKWETFLKELYDQGRLTEDLQDDWAVAIISSFEAGPEMAAYPQKVLGNIMIPSGRRIFSTGIRSNTKCPDDAFALLNLVYTDVSYGNLLIFGTEDRDAVDESRNWFFPKLMFGLKDFIFPIGEGSDWFSTVSERNRYYENAKLFVCPDEMILSFPKKQELEKISGQYDTMLFLSEQEIREVYGAKEEYAEQLADCKRKLSALYDEALAYAAQYRN